MRSRQLDLTFRPYGGKRDGAGRKRTRPGRPRLRHDQRPKLQARFPVHITKRMRADVPRLRRFELSKVLQRAFVRGCSMRKVVNGTELTFRICQFSIQGNHIHMICEASDNTALARGIQGWSVRVARGINGFWGREGSVFDDRYHLEILTSPSQTRNALCYVLQNARRHHERLDPKYRGMDPFSSAMWFDGWRNANWKQGLAPQAMRPVAEAATWMLRVGWQKSRLGLLAIDEVPKAARKQRAGDRA